MLASFLLSTFKQTLLSRRYSTSTGTLELLTRTTLQYYVRNFFSSSHQLYISWWQFGKLGTSWLRWGIMMVPPHQHGRRRSQCSSNRLLRISYLVSGNVIYKLLHADISCSGWHMCVLWSFNDEKRILRLVRVDGIYPKTGQLDVEETDAMYAFYSWCLSVVLILQIFYSSDHFCK